MLLPCLRPGDIVLMVSPALPRQRRSPGMAALSSPDAWLPAQDNARFHRKNIVEALFHAAGVHVLWLPSYSPEWNPVRCAAALPALPAQR